MTRIDFRGVALALALLVLAACGSATEVGNPTGDIATRTIVGAIDASTLPAELDAAKALAADVAASVDPTELVVAAIATETGVSDIEAPVDAAGAFEVAVDVGARYDWEVRLGTTTIGPFSFDQDVFGHKGAGLRISMEGPPIDMGVVRYEDGVFVPEDDPFRLQGRLGTPTDLGLTGN
jgi:hypothetical protein